MPPFLIQHTHHSIPHIIHQLRPQKKQTHTEKIIIQPKSTQFVHKSSFSTTESPSLLLIIITPHQSCKPQTLHLLPFGACTCELRFNATIKGPGQPTTLACSMLSNANQFAFLSHCYKDPTYACAATSSQRCSSEK